MTSEPDLHEPDHHEPVMVESVIALLEPPLSKPGALVVDGTVGLGGHSDALLDRFPQLRLVGIDRDTEALERSRERLASYGGRVRLVHAVYDQLPGVLTELGESSADAILFDLGVSSMQLDRSDRGFRYLGDAPLDMRMDQTDGLTAADVVRSYSVDQLRRLIGEYGEEKFAGRIAEGIVSTRERRPITTTADLVRIVDIAIPASAPRRGHRAKRTFQALRIEVNAELETLHRALPLAIGYLALHGRIAVLAYHSLEDRIVKRTFSGAARDDSPVDLPVVIESMAPQYRLLTRGAMRPDATEVAANPRASSARLRAAERIRVAA